ncbi:MAG: class I SAM-dependent methyltransferase [Candidatus Microthrix sp.]|nr:class I SAM-dependent methyltransferase [Candidatus Microthrix sp.]
MSATSNRLAAGLARMIAGRVSTGTLHLTTPDGTRSTHRGAAAGPEATLVAHDPTLARRVVAEGAAGLGAGYVDGWWDTDDLPAFLRLAAASIDRTNAGSLGSKVQRVGSSVWDRRPRRRGGAVDAMADHYNLGNRFYEQWLDPSVTYSSGFYDGTDDLAEAQRAKYDRVLNRAGITAGANVLEIGCGWGGFAEAATTVGASITGVTIAQEQLDYAEKRAAQGGWSHASDFQLRDFADATGRYDAIVSIEMIESIEQDRWPELFDTVARCLKPGGRATFQIITIDDGLWDTYRQRNDFIREYIFPGGRLPAPKVISELSASAGLATVDVLDFGQSYARTLEHWSERFEAAWPEIETMGFDDRFRRMWRYYLAYCQVGFELGRISVQQWTWEHAG